MGTRKKREQKTVSLESVLKDSDALKKKLTDPLQRKVERERLKILKRSLQNIDRVNYARERRRQEIRHEINEEHGPFDDEEIAREWVWPAWEKEGLLPKDDARLTRHHDQKDHDLDSEDPDE